MSSLNYQVGGDSFKKMPYQPIIFISRMRFNFIQGSILYNTLKFVQTKDLDFLKKASHFNRLGSEIKYINFALPLDEEIETFVKSNELPECFNRLIQYIADQLWIGINEELLNIKSYAK